MIKDSEFSCDQWICLQSNGRHLLSPCIVIFCVKFSFIDLCKEINNHGPFHVLEDYQHDFLY